MERVLSAVAGVKARISPVEQLSRRRRTAEMRIKERQHIGQQPGEPE